MTATCRGGMVLEGPEGPTGGHECGTPGCRSCAIEIETTHYCRWCAIAPRRA
jgi:hypothetical protein